MSFPQTESSALASSTSPKAVLPALSTNQELLESGSPERMKPHLAAMVHPHPFANRYSGDISSEIDPDSLEPHPFVRGAYGDVRRASLRDGTRVAIKFLRIYTSSQDKLKKVDNVQSLPSELRANVGQ